VSIDRIDLAEGMRVDVEVGHGRNPLSVTVLGFLGPTILLRPDVAPLGDDLPQGSDAFIVQDRGGRLHALRGRLGLLGELLTFRVADAVHGQRRWWSRCAVALDVVLEDPQGGAAVRTRSADVSAGGVLVVRPEGHQVLGAYRVTLSGPELPQPVSTSAVPVRSTADRIALEFVDVPAATQAVLAGLVIDHLQRQPATGAP
jgi:PilZ domain